jgi:hypothetical protein
MRKKRFMMISLVMALLPFFGVCVDATAEIVPLQVGIIDPTYDHTNPQKSPTLVPEVSIEDYTLTFDASCLGCELRLLDDDGMLVYSTKAIM